MRKKCCGVIKNPKFKKIYGDPKKLLSFKKAAKPASIKTNFNAVTSLS